MSISSTPEEKLAKLRECIQKYSSLTDLDSEDENQMDLEKTISENFDIFSSSQNLISSFPIDRMLSIVSNINFSIFKNNFEVLSNLIKNSVFAYKEQSILLLDKIKCLQCSLSLDECIQLLGLFSNCELFSKIVQLYEKQTKQYHEEKTHQNEPVNSNIDKEKEENTTLQTKDNNIFEKQKEEHLEENFIKKRYHIQNIIQFSLEPYNINIYKEKDATLQSKNHSITINHSNYIEENEHIYQITQPLSKIHDEKKEIIATKHLYTSNTITQSTKSNEYFINKTIEHNSINDILNIINRKDLESFQKLITANQEWIDQPIDSNNHTLLHYSCQNDKLSFVKYLIEECRCNYIMYDNDGFTPFHTSCAYGRINIVKYFIEKVHIPYDIQTSQGVNGLQIATKYQQNVIEKYLKNVLKQQSKFFLQIVSTEI